MRNPIRTSWPRWKFHLSALVVLVPLYGLPVYLAEKPPPHGPEIERVVTAGPFALTLITHDAPPERGVGGRMLKEYEIHLPPGAMDRIRGVFLRVGQPRGLRVAGALAEGDAYEQEVHVILPPRLTGDEALWLTVEEWNGTVHQASVPLADILGGRP